MSTDNQLTKQFFDSLTPEDPAYYSPDVMDIRDDNDYSKVASKRGREMFERLQGMDWKDVLREYLRNWIKGMQMLHVVSTDFNTGNSSPYQYGWYPHGYNEIAYQKLLDMVRSEIRLADVKDRLSFGFSCLTIRRNLGYGKSVDRTIQLDIDFDIPSNKKGIKFKCSARVYGDPGFYDEFVQIANNIKAEMEIFKKEPLLKTDLRPYNTYPDIASYKDKKDQLGIIHYYMIHDTEGKKAKCKFTQGFIDACKDAMAFCTTLPRVEFTAERDALYYKGTKYTAQDYDDFSNEYPDELRYLSFHVEDVLVYKYGLLDTTVEHIFDKASDIRSFIYHWHDKLHQPITPDIQAWIEKWVSPDRMSYVMGT